MNKIKKQHINLDIAYCNGTNNHICSYCKRCTAHYDFSEFPEWQVFTMVSPLVEKNECKNFWIFEHLIKR